MVRDWEKRQRLKKFIFTERNRYNKNQTEPICVSLTMKEIEMILNCLDFFFENPIVWEVFASLSKTLLKKKKNKYGVAAVWERMRWEIDIVLQREDLAHKLNNNYKAFYSRLFNMANGVDFFTKRESVFDHVHYLYLASPSNPIMKET